MPNNALGIAQQFSGLPMEDLIGGPLNAVTKANAQMGISQTHYLLDTCFNYDEKTKNYTPIMIQMSLSRGVISYDDKGEAKIENLETKFDLPLLTIIPINSLGVDSTSIHFEMEVKTSSSETEKEESKKSTNAEATLEGKAGWGPFSVSISGKVSYSSEDSRTHDTHYENSNSAKYSVDVHAGQLPLPRGVNTIIDAFSQNISPIEIPKPQPKNNTPTNSTEGE